MDIGITQPKTTGRKHRYLFQIMKSCIIKPTFCLLTTIWMTSGQESPSPFQFSWPRETILMTSGIAGGYIGYYRLTNLPLYNPDLQKLDLPPWDRFAVGWYNPYESTVSDVLLVAVGGAELFADAWEKVGGKTKWTPLLEDGLILAEAQAWSSAINLNVRAFRWHPRPFILDTLNGSSKISRTAGEASTSFYSGHSSGAFVGAVYLSIAYPLWHPDFQYTGWLWAGSLTAASSVAVLRVTSGKHYPSDVVAGAAMGALLGWGFARFHERAGASSKTSWIFDAWPQPGGLAIQAVKPMAAW